MARDFFHFHPHIKSFWSNFLTTSMVSKFNANRYPGKPLKQPLYNFHDIPKCQPNLDGSILYEITKVEDFVDSMAEMVLLCNEAMRRNKLARNNSGSKPLSLEYIADRLVRMD